MDHSSPQYKLEIDQQIEISQANFIKLKSSFDFRELKNEAETRLKLIDSILFDCLGWDKIANVKVEESTESGFADYLLTTTRRIGVIEAKKRGFFFDLPITDGKPKALSIKSIIEKNDGLAKAIRQAAAYSQASGIPYTIVTNGEQFVAFLGTRDDGLSPLEGRAIAFTSMEQIESNYSTFWSLFSKEGFDSLNLREVLLAKAERSLPVKLSANIIHYPGIRHRNDLQTDLSILSELILEDLLHDDLEDEFLEECYCESGALSQYSLLARNIINVRYYQDSHKGDVNIQSVRGREGINPEFFSNALSRRPIILLGDVGVGKTSFIRRLIQTSQREVGGNGLVIYIDLGEKLILVESVITAITQEIERILREEYKIDIYESEFVKKVFADELKRFSNGIYRDLPQESYILKEVEYIEKLLADHSNYIGKALGYIAKDTKNISIFLDNIDQRSTEDQQNVYLAAQELSAQTAAVVFVSLRPETFYRSNESGVLKAYHQRAFTISPPRIDLVLSKRLRFGLKLAQGKAQIPRLADYGTQKLEGLSTMLEVMIDSIEERNGRRKELMIFIDNFAAGNVRTAVDMVKGFLSSGHVNSEKIISIKDDTGYYVVPLHEFLKAIIYGELQYYDPDTSPIKNMYDVTSRDEKEHFLRAILIKVLSYYADSANSNKGFIATGFVYETIQALGYTAEQVDLAFYYCLKNELIESSIDYIIKESVTPNQVRVTTKGVCYIELLINKFQYVDAVLIDTPILNESLQAYMLAHMDNDINIRLMRSARFLEYLNDIFNNNLRSKGDRVVNSFWDDTYKTLKKEIEFIYESQTIKTNKGSMK